MRWFVQYFGLFWIIFEVMYETPGALTFWGSLGTAVWTTCAAKGRRGAVGRLG